MRVWIEKTIVKGRLDRQEGELELGKVLWSPTRAKGGADIYSSMRDLKENDIVLHLIDNNEIVGVSKVNKTYYERNIEIGSPWDGPTYIIELKEFIRFTTSIKRDQILHLKNKETLDDIRLNNKVFYNANLTLNQGSYLTEVPPDLVFLINSSFEENSNKCIPFLKEIIFNTYKEKMQRVGFVFEGEQTAVMQKRGKELKFTHPKLIKKFKAEGLRTGAKKFYIKPLSDESNGVIGLATGGSSPLYDNSIFTSPNQIDTHNNIPAWSSKNDTFKKLLLSISNYLNSQPDVMNFPLNTILYIQVIDNTNTAITSNITKVIIRRDLKPVLNKFAQYELCFGNQFHIKPQGLNIKSSGFKISGESSTVYLRDTPNVNLGQTNITSASQAGDVFLNRPATISAKTGVLSLFKIDDNGNAVTAAKNVGTVNYEKGEILLNTINITETSLSSGVIEIQAFPESNDVIGLRDLYLSLDINNSTINMLRDVIASGDEISGTRFINDFYTSSYSNGNLIRK